MPYDHKSARKPIMKIMLHFVLLNITKVGQIINRKTIIEKCHEAERREKGKWEN